ncbi:MAG TPA: GNAT family N-acetyltransferase [Candidatus Limnocylindrales bacterium]
MDIEVHPLDDSRWVDLTALFDEGGDPRWCSCMYWRLRARDFAASTSAQNRDGLRRLAGRQPAPGLVAYDGGRAVGWIGLGPREDFERLERSTLLGRVDDRAVWSIVCFVVARSRRGRGIARTLLDAAIDFAASRGAEALEAYPADTASRRISAAAAYTGTLPMFEQAGFDVVRMSDSVTDGARRAIVRRALGDRTTATGTIRHESG